MKDTILKYIRSNKVFTLATTVNDIPYCANCFYAYAKESKTLIFLSDDATFHIQTAINNKSVAGTIQNGVTEIAKLQGIQFKGTFVVPNEKEQEVFYKQYYAQFPFAKEIPSPIWGVQLNWIKMTDNTLGFGTKQMWER